MTFDLRVFNPHCNDTNQTTFQPQLPGINSSSHPDPGVQVLFSNNYCIFAHSFNNRLFIKVCGKFWLD
jgi:hypothetical protein